MGIRDKAPERTRERLPERGYNGSHRVGASPIERRTQDYPRDLVLSRSGVAVRRRGTSHGPLPHHGDGDQTPSRGVDVERGI